MRSLFSYMGDIFKWMGEIFAPNDYYYNYVNTNPPDKYQYPYPSIPYPITW